jgi:hypothetical protein
VVGHGYDDTVSGHAGATVKAARLGVTAGHAPLGSNLIPGSARGFKCTETWVDDFTGGSEAQKKEDA